VLGDSLRRRKPSAPDRPPRGPRLAGVPPTLRTVGRWLLAALIILLGSFGTGYLLSTQVLFPAPETAGSGVPVPDMYGLDREEAEGLLVEEELGVGRVETLASDDVPVGQVIAQSPVAGQQLRPGATVDLVLSAGPPELPVPPVQGLAQALARDLLEQLGFAVEVQQLPAEEAAGVVTRTDPAPGSRQQLPATITLFVSTGPPTPIIDSTIAAPSPTGGS
jgi:PASTA domain